MAKQSLIYISLYICVHEIIHTSQLIASSFRVAVVTDLLSQNLPRAANRQRTLERLPSSRRRYGQNRHAGGCRVNRVAVESEKIHERRFTIFGSVDL